MSGKKQSKYKKKKYPTQILMTHKYYHLKNIHFLENRANPMT